MKKKKTWQAQWLKESDPKVGFELWLLNKYAMNNPQDLITKSIKQLIEFYFADEEIIELLSKREGKACKLQKRTQKNIK